jgi:hypothetical protein
MGWAKVILHRLIINKLTKELPFLSHNRPTLLGVLLQRRGKDERGGGGKGGELTGHFSKIEDNESKGL